MKITLDEYDKDKYAKVVENWDISVKTDPRFASILEYILENGIFFTIAELIKISHDVRRYGDNETNKVFFLRGENGEVFGFVIAGMLFDEKTMLLREVAIHPDFQGQGVARQAIKSLIKDSQQLFGEKPELVQAYIENTNKNSLKLFKKLGFEINEVGGSRFFKALCHCPDQILEK